jgi:nucleotide-binding universal stress UspA family protein
MFSNVLLAVDLAHPESWARALPVPDAMARRDGALLHVVTVVPDFGMSLVQGFFPENFEAKARAHAREMLDTLVAKELPDRADVRVEVCFGHPAPEILRVAGLVGADLIVLESHAPGERPGLVAGSQADRLVHAARCSVLVLRG